MAFAAILFVTMSDGSKWMVKSQTIIDHRDQYKEDSSDFFAQYPDEMEDWAMNNMNWDELDAERVKEPTPFDYHDKWPNDVVTEVKVS